MEQYGLSNIVVHAPYIINIANTTKPEVYELGVNFLQNEIERTQAIGERYCLTSRCACRCRCR